MKTHREYRKHTVTGEIVAVELFEGALVGVRACSRPEEQTRGALPVMEITPSDVEWYEANKEHFEVYVPAPLPDELLIDLAAAEDDIKRCERIYEAKKGEAKAAREAYEASLRHVRDLIAEAKAAREQPSLFDGNKPAA